MSEQFNSAIRDFAPSRRQTIRGLGMAMGAFAAAPHVWAANPQPQANPQPSEADKSRTFLHQEIEMQASSQRIYEALLDSKLFAAFTGLPAEIDRKAGGTFSMFGGLIVGRNIELIPDKRIVQAWRPTSWPSGVYSIVKFELVGSDVHTKVILDHTGFPTGKFADLDSGWHARYWEPLQKFLS